MKNSKILFLLGGILLALSSCAPVYIPTVHNVPVLKEKGASQIQAWVGSSGIDIQGAQMTGERSAAMGSNNNWHAYVEGGYGMIHTKTPGLTLSAFGGLALGAARGTGTFTVNGTAYERTGEGTVLKPFIQGNLGFQSDYFNIGISTRLAYLQFLSKGGSSCLFFHRAGRLSAFGRPQIEGHGGFGLKFPAGQSRSRCRLCAVHVWCRLAIYIAGFTIIELCLFLFFFALFRLYLIAIIQELLHGSIWPYGYDVAFV